jgi:cytochrome c2
MFPNVIGPLAQFADVIFPTSRNIQEETAMNSTKTYMGRFLGYLPIISIALLFALPGANAASDFSGDAELGKKVFKKCKACHQVGENAKNKTGPVLNNIIGRKAASFEGYGYGKSIRAAREKGLVWEEEKLFTYIRSPKKFLRAYLGNKKAKTKMKFILKKEDARKNVIAYLATFSAPVEKMDEKPDEKAGMDKQTNAEMMTHKASNDQICVQNNFPKELLLVAEAKGGERKIKTSGQSGVLCVKAGEDGKGTVGVFENEDALEGCSRLAKAGKTEILIAYASFDNCKWQE